MTDTNNRRCSRCLKVFTSRKGCDQHIAMKHAGKGERIAVGESSSRKQYEPSMAELMIEAQMDRALGNLVPDWLEEML